ncbi:MAG: RNA pseudouridine synthase [Verrucomicrobiota bacterium]|nr:RNA pseudouridine synthase [Verrucomicrobiota bacterium]
MPGPVPVAVAASPQEFPLGPGVRLIKDHPSGLIALYKPEGVRSHPNDAKADAQALLTIPYDEGTECFHWTDPAGVVRHLWLLNRLDSPTSGLILCATESTLADTVKNLFENRKVKKTYYAVVKGNARNQRGVWRDQFNITKKQGLVRAGCGGTVIASVDVRCLEATHGRIPISLLELRPATGRTHQLRVQCAEHGFPIVGDATYGDFRVNREIAKTSGTKRLFLHSGKIELSLGNTHGSFSAEYPMPAEFKELLKAYR